MYMTKLRYFFLWKNVTTCSILYCFTFDSFDEMYQKFVTKINKVKLTLVLLEL